MCAHKFLKLDYYFSLPVPPRPPPRPPNMDCYTGTYKSHQYGAHNWTEPHKNVLLAGFSCCPARVTVVHGGSLWITVIHAGSTMDQPGPRWAAWISATLIRVSSVNNSIPQDLPHDCRPRCSVWLHAMSTLIILSILSVSGTLKVLVL